MLPVASIDGLWWQQCRVRVQHSIASPKRPHLPSDDDTRSRRLSRRNNLRRGLLALLLVVGLWVYAKLLVRHGSISPIATTLYTAPFDGRAASDKPSLSWRPPFRVVVSLTTTPSRLDKVMDSVRSLLRQSLAPDQIYVNIPKGPMKRKPNRSYDEVEIPRELEALSPLVKINRCVDDGPATKLIGTLRHEHDPSTLIITVDDDFVYPSDLVEALAWESEYRPNVSLGVCGWGIMPTPWHSVGAVPAYVPYFMRPTGRYVDVLQACCGNAYRRGFFRDLDALADIPPVCVTVDDVWIAGYLHLAEDRRAAVISKRLDPSDPSWKTAEAQSSARGMKLSEYNHEKQVHYKCMQAMEERFHTPWVHNSERRRSVFVSAMMLRGLIPLLLLCGFSLTAALQIGVVLTWGTRTHVAPVFDALRPLASSASHRVTFLGTAQNAHYADESPWIAGPVVVRESCEVQGYDAILRAVTQIDERVENTAMFARLFQRIHDCYEANVPAYMSAFRAERLDLVVCDFFDRACMDAAAATRTALALSAPLGMYGVGTAWFVPDIFAPAPIEHWVASPWQRAKALWAMAPFIASMIGESSRLQAMQRRLALEIPFIEACEYLQTHLVLAHNLIGLEPARSLPNNIVPFGPIVHDDTLPSLEPALQASLDELHERGTRVVFVSFGSMIDATAAPAFYVKLGAAVKTLLVEGINVQGFDAVAVIWASKRHDPELVKRLSTQFKGRFFAPVWVTQRRLLLHDAVVAMVSHGGYGSVTEAVLAGKPLVLVPFYGDQFLNVVYAQDVGIGVQLDKYTFEPRDVVSRLTALLQSERLPEALRRLQTIARINSETSPVVVSNAVRLAATVGVEHLVPRDVRLSLLHRFPPWLLVSGALLLWLVARASLFVLRRCGCRRADRDSKDKRA
ncbi:hypothetical protein P43SY_006946 [Pythium insidiosum]|uniref:UDP-glycosyltransferases domain-containing protein n=1 Tax=Pythium insidiosum TaxID=114742 RepID=A0AAD5LLP4_PYTIN|nr:hypothetical protein P43SY_006946 [Pythium insidiosum]